MAGTAISLRSGESRRERSRLPTPNRSEIQPGRRVSVVEKQNQTTGLRTEGVVARILTKSPSHPHGIKVMLEDGRVGRVQSILADS